MRALLITIFTSVLLVGCGDWSPNFNIEEFTQKDEPTALEDVAKRQEYLGDKSKEPSVYLRDIAGIYEDYGLVLPNGNRIRVCSAFGCSHKQIYRLNSDLLRKAKSKLEGAGGASGERSGIARALSVIELEMGPATGTDKDKQGGSWRGNGDPAQMNATDEALNATSILMVMFRYGLIRYHDLEKPQWKSNTLYAVLRDRSTGEKFGIDMGYRENGGEIKVFDWSGDAP